MTDLHEIPHIKDIAVTKPDLEKLRANADQYLKELASDDPSVRLAAFRAWDIDRQEWSTWGALVGLRFQQDTRNAEFKAAREELERLKPKIEDLTTKIKKALLASPYRADFEKEFGPQLFDLWDCDARSFDPCIEEDLVAESKLSAQYTELMASARFELCGQTMNQPTLARYNSDPDRETRRNSHDVQWRWMTDHATELDTIYSDLVTLRTKMAKQLGHEDFIAVGYDRMHRIDYGEQEVDQFRAEVREHIVPFANDLLRIQAKDLGVPDLMFWDEAIHALAGNPKPQGDYDWMLERAQEMFDELGGELGALFHLMTTKGLMDLESREGKAGGGFCTTFPAIGVPFIFANFNGTKGDVAVFTHEMGHAFQSWSGRDKPVIDYRGPTPESCEIHSMGLEFLTWPSMGRFFGEEGAEQFRRIHLIDGLKFLAYGVAVDHFQHLAYRNPEASAEERLGFWTQMEEMYLPHRDYGDLASMTKGRLWQLKPHIYLAPFYYIDYTLAQTCALQLWLRAEADREEAMNAYVALCKRGGEAPFSELISSAGLTSPFAAGCLRDVVAKARVTLGV